MAAANELVGAPLGDVFYRWQALRAGWSAGAIRRKLDAGEWVRARHGAYAEASSWDRLDALGRHLLVARAAMGALAGESVLCGPTAAVLHGLPDHGLDLSAVNLWRSDERHGRLLAGVRQHQGELTARDVCSIDGVRATSLARTALDIARTAPLETGLVVVDAALRQVAPLELREVLERQRSWAGAATAARVLQLADGRSESVGESLGRLVIVNGGLPTPELQADICDDVGRLVGRVDYLFRKQRTIGEFDGRGKYGRISMSDPRPENPALDPARAADPGERVWREKLREDALRELGFEVVRFVWAELWTPSVIIERFERAFRRAGQR